MSHKAFYQTFYQTEALFRLPDDPLAFGARALVAAPALLADAPVVVAPVLPVVVPTVTLPVLPVAVAPVVLPAEVLPVEVVETVIAPVVELVEESVAPVVEAVALPKPTVPRLQHRVLIVVDEPSPGEVLFLQNVLKAIELDTNSVDLLTRAHWQGNDFRPLLSDRQVDQFLIFGLPFSALGLDIEMDAYHPVRFDGITFMQADAPNLIETDRALKKRLWESLKRVFLRG